MLINDTLHTTSPLRQRIRDYYRISESAVSYTHLTLPTILLV